MTINLDTTDAESAAIEQIAMRWDGMQSTPTNIHATRWNVTACHSNGCPLDLQALLGTDDLDFNHDMKGITENIDRTTGRLIEPFIPLCAIARKGAQQ